MELKFYAKGDLLVTRPGFRPSSGGGEQPEYIGREFIPATGGKPAANPAKPTPHTADSESYEGRRLRKLCRRDASLWPADAATAAACGVPFVQVKFHGGEWVEDRPAAKPAASPKPARKED